MTIKDFRVEASPIGTADISDIDASGLLLDADQQDQLDQSRRLLLRRAEVLAILDGVARSGSLMSECAIELLDYIRHGDSEVTP